MLEHLILARHGQTEWNVAGRAQGRADSPLTEAGLAQARSLGRTLADLGVTHIVASPLPRALHTARIAAEIAGCAVSTDDRLVERSFGTLEGRFVAEAMADDPRWTAVLRATDPSVAADGGETLHDVAARMLPALEDARALPHRCVAVLTHGQSISATLAALGGQDAAGYRHGNCGYTPLSLRDGRLVFDRWNLAVADLADA